MGEIFSGENFLGENFLTSRPTKERGRGEGGEVGDEGEGVTG